jgi:RNA polymerase sigma-70 factor (ECF subfamily)
MQPEPTVEWLMARYQAGDRAAAAALVQRLSPQIHRFFLAQLFSRRHADDLLQETWMRVHQARQTYRPGQPLLPWLYAIARHARVDHYRRNQRFEAAQEPLQDLPDAAPQADRDSNLEELLATLPESQREVIVMLKVADMSLEEVARATSSSVGSVKQKAHRAYESLRARLGGDKAKRPTREGRG